MTQVNAVAALHGFSEPTAGVAALRLLPVHVPRPEGVNAVKIGASSKKGGLTVTLPTSPAAKQSEKQIRAG